MQTLLAAIFVFVVIVFIHELGHFLFAKRAGILTREFAIGFGPKLFSFKKGETRYTLRLFPLGGFVRMAGEDPEVIKVKSNQNIALSLNDEGKVEKIYLDRLNERQADIVGTIQKVDLERELVIVLQTEDRLQTYAVDPKAEMFYENEQVQIAPWDRQFGGKRLAQRAMTIFAGPLFNIILAFVLFSAVIFSMGVPNEEIVQLGPLQEEGAAQQSGLREGDIVVAINKKPVTSTQQLVEMIQSSEGKPMLWLIQRDGKEQNIKVTANYNKDAKTWLIGAYIQNVYEPAGAVESLQAGVKQTYSYTVLILDNFKRLITGGVSFKELSGPVGIMDFTGEVAKRGVASLMHWTALLSLYLGIFNLLPIPALDGSRLLFIGYEALRGRPVDPQRESMVHLVGFAFLMLLMIAVTYNDLLRLFS